MGKFNFVEYKREYNKRNYTDFKMHMNKVKDKDVIDYLDTVPNKKEFIVNLIRKHMEENK